MRIAAKRHRSSSGGAIALTLIALLMAIPSQAGAIAPTVDSSWASAVFSSTARLSATVNPNSAFTTYHFEYLTNATYDANGGNFTGALRVPAAADANIGSGSSSATVTQQLSGLLPETAYRYRVVAKNGSGSTPGDPLPFITQSIGGGPVLADGRGWEMVSPVDKNGGQVEAPGAIAKGGVLQAAANGQSVSYGSISSFAGGAGAPPASQYLATRTAGGWSTENLTAPIFSGSYDATDTGVPYQLFSPDLARAILLNGDHCRGEGKGCAVANPPLAGTDAPAGYQNYYLRQGSSFTALLGNANSGFLSLDPKSFDVSLAGTSPDLAHPVLSTCAALSANATEAPSGEGCDHDRQNLYLWSASTGLSLINLKPGDPTGTPGAALAAQSGAISADGARAYFTLEGNLYLRSAGQTKQADAGAGGGGSFEAASADGSVAFFSKGEHLWRYLSSADTATDLTPAGGVKGVLGASTDGTRVYFQDASALKLWSSGTTSTVAAGADAARPINWPAATGTARVGSDGIKLLFLSKAKLTEYDNTDLDTGEPDSQIFLFEAGGPGALSCISCNPSFARPIGPSTVPGSRPNGTAQGSTDSYKPRALSANGKRAFFESDDALVLTDTNNNRDVYQWEAQGEGSCAKAGGCISLISSGRGSSPSTLIDASADGADAFFLTDGSLVGQDPGATDLYDARVGGGFAEPPPPIICEGDACQPLPSPPTDPTLTTLLKGPGNPGVRYPKERCSKGKVRRKGRCVLKGKGKGGAKKGEGKGGRRR